MSERPYTLALFFQEQSPRLLILGHHPNLFLRVVFVKERLKGC